MSLVVGIKAFPETFIHIIAFIFLVGQNALRNLRITLRWKAGFTQFTERKKKRRKKKAKTHLNISITEAPVLGKVA